MKLMLSFAVVLMLIFSACEDDPSSSGNGGGGNPPANEVWMSGNAFSPSSITVAAGTTIRWVNKEGVTHTVTSSSATPLFDSGNLGRDQSFSFTFDTAGSYPYHCRLHAGMNGTVIVQ